MKQNGRFPTLRLCVLRRHIQNCATRHSSQRPSPTTSPTAATSAAAATTVARTSSVFTIAVSPRRTISTSTAMATTRRWQLARPQRLGSSSTTATAIAAGEAIRHLPPDLLRLLVPIVPAVVTAVPGLAPVARICALRGSRRSRRCSIVCCFVRWCCATVLLRCGWLLERRSVDPTVLQFQSKLSRRGLQLLQVCLVHRGVCAPLLALARQTLLPLPAWWRSSNLEFFTRLLSSEGSLHLRRRSSALAKRMLRARCVCRSVPNRCAAD
jgi:hypothetical protein